MASAIEIKGLVETQRNITKLATELTSTEFVAGMREASMLVLKDARSEAPVDTGRLKNSLTAEIVVREGNVVTGIVGTNVLHGPYMELGTKPHWPPIAALRTWAARHGVNVYQVAKAIAMKGTKPRKYLQNAFDKNQERIKQIIGDKISSLVQKFGGS